MDGKTICSGRQVKERTLQWHPLGTADGLQDAEYCCLDMRPSWSGALNGRVALQMETIALQGYTKNVFYTPEFGTKTGLEIVCGEERGEGKQRINDEYYQVNNSENTSKINSILSFSFEIITA